MNLTEAKDGIVLEVFVKPNASEFKIALEGDEVVVWSTEEPAKGKVNKELIKELTKFFGARVELASGATSRQKRFLIRGISKSEAESLLTSVNLN